MRPSPRYVLRSAILVLLVGGVASCGPIEISTGGDLSAEDVAARAEEALAPKVSGTPRVTCREGLSVEAGDRTSCTMTIDGTEYQVDATVSHVDGARYSLDFRSEDYHQGAGAGSIFADEVARRAERSLSDRYGMRPDVTCPHDLAGAVGKSLRCALRVDGMAYRMTATVQKIDGRRYDLGFEVDDKPLRTDA